LNTWPPGHNPILTLLNEELGAVMQVRKSQVDVLVSAFAQFGFPSTSIRVIGSVRQGRVDQSFTVVNGAEVIFSSTRQELQRLWSETSYHMQSIRDDASSAREEFDLIEDASYRGLYFDLTYKHSPSRSLSRRPKVAILREQGVNGHMEMAWSFTAAGFDAVD